MRIDLPRYWYSRSFHFLTVLLLPFSWLFALIVQFRRWLYQVGLLKTQRFPVPIIVVGNIVVGGTGKTPCVLWLVNFLEKHGYSPGIVSRGVGGIKHQQAHIVQSTDSPQRVGDEAVLLRRNTQCPIVVCLNRAEAVRKLLKQFTCNIVISDDGLQHYSLGRDIEIVMIDGVRYFGNLHLLPAGPLRESVKRLHNVDFVVVNGGDERNAYTMTLLPTQFVSMNNFQEKIDCVHFPYKNIHAVAGIGHPERFFSTLKTLGFTIKPHSFKDHYSYDAHDFEFKDEYPIVMTEKDAVKCFSFADQRYWYLSITAKMNKRLEQELLLKIKKLEVNNVPVQKNSSKFSDPTSC